MARLLRISALLPLLLLAAAGPAEDPRLVLTGRVVDALGRPVGGAEVRLIRWKDLWESFSGGEPADALAVATTSADGTYRVTDPDVSGAQDRCACCAYVYLSVRCGRGQAMSGQFLRDHGRLRARDLVLSAPFVLAGRVTDPEGRPVPLAEVSFEILDIGGGEEPGMPMYHTPETYTDERGEYAFEPIAVRPGLSARVTIRHQWLEGYSRPAGLPATLRVPTRFHVDREVEIPDLTRRPRLDVTLQRGLTIRGRALDPEGNPVSGIQVGCAWRSAKTGPDGRFVIRGGRLTGGPIWFGGHRPDRRVRVPVHDGEAIVSAGDFVLRKRLPEPKPAATVEGTIYEHDGRSRSDRGVYARICARRLSDGEVIGRDESGRDGRFSIDLDAGGPVRLTATANLTVGRLRIDETVDPAAGPVQLRIPLEGVIRLEFDGGTPAGVEIEVDGEMRGRSYSSSRVSLKLPAGPHHLRLIVLGGPTIELDVVSVPTDPERVIRVPIFR